jgi:hypothetical protein
VLHQFFDGVTTDFFGKGLASQIALCVKRAPWYGSAGADGNAARFDQITAALKPHRNIDDG